MIILPVHNYISCNLYAIKNNGESSKKCAIKFHCVWKLTARQTLRNAMLLTRVFFFSSKRRSSRSSVLNHVTVCQLDDIQGLNFKCAVERMKDFINLNFKVNLDFSWSISGLFFFVFEPEWDSLNISISGQKLQKKFWCLLWRTFNWISHYVNIH